MTKSTTPPFSDKLMMFHTRALSTGGIATYGGAIPNVLRHDLIPQFTRLTAELGKYGDKGAEIMIKHKWLEEQPSAANRDKLINHKTKK
ncbi:Protein of unknown function [Lentibacillus halodurans]|uniref:Uncharacterized protein n=1 Tax=Lentibacillus halodurans TaxID=237679 RepID=A0A1I0X7L4_9BACI|nr:Protein of unknown function [Lentibacillus halodurans]